MSLFSHRQLKLVLILVTLSGLICVDTSAQMARKPSPTRAGQEGIKVTTEGKRFLPALLSQADFDQLARIYNAKTPYALPHLMFIIDRRDNKIYYVNSQMFRFHQDFAN